MMLIQHEQCLYIVITAMCGICQCIDGEDWWSISGIIIHNREGCVHDVVIIRSPPDPFVYRQWDVLVMTKSYRSR